MSYMQEYEKWLASPALSEQEHAELESIRDDEKEIRERFYGPLEFGTAGLRGTMKVGLHQMNIHVIRWATQGFANVICAEGEEAKGRGVALCMDCRNHSMEFARAAAEVCAANGIHVRIFESLRPTPELSFAVREYDCQAGINVTASHNPKEYNGYKVYWSDGAQLPPQHAAAIARELEQIDIFTGIRRMEFDDAKAQGLIEIMGAETDERFMSHVMAMVNDRESMAKVADTFHMVYTPFHGCGWKLVPEALRGIEGYSHLWLLWEFSETKREGWRPTVRPPRLGGNRRVGVFASRSPFRPNAIGLSCVKLLGVVHHPEWGTVLRVAGADLMDGTPIYDVKPYLPHADCRPEATGGYSSDGLAHVLTVILPPEWEEKVPAAHRASLRAVLAQDPRPAYQQDSDRVYGFPFAGLEVHFTVAGDVLTVCGIFPAEKA